MARPVALAAFATSIVLASACMTQIVVPTASPTPVASETPSPRPTEPALPTPDASAAVAHPTGATDVVLRMSRSGGFLYPGATLDEAPTFTLYGDGRVIYTVDEALPGGAVARELRQAQLNEEQIGALLENALGAGGLAVARDRYADVPLADGTTTNFQINAGGVHKTIAVYALGEFDEPGPDSAARDAFEALAASLRTFAGEVEAGSVVDLGPFEPDRHRATIFPLSDGELQPTGEWPWPDLQPADFERDNSGFGRRVVTAAHGEAFAALPIGDTGDPVVVGPDGVTYLIRVRPLLPDET